MTKMFLYIQGKSNLLTLSKLSRNPIQDLRVSLRRSDISFSYERQCCSKQIYNILYGHTWAHIKGPAFSLQGNTRLFLSPCKLVCRVCHRQNTAETDIQYPFVGRSARHSSHARYPAKEANIFGHKKKVMKDQHRRERT